MTVEQAAASVIGALKQVGIPHMIVGSLSSNYYGIPRNTKDADVEIALSDRSALSRLASHLGGSFSMDPQIRFETITGNIRHIVRLEGTPFVVELFELTDDAYQQERFRRRVEICIPQLNLSACIPTAEDVIVQKLRWARPKDLEDARDVMGVQASALDRAYIESWCRKLKLMDRFKALQESLSDLED